MGHLFQMNTLGPAVGEVTTPEVRRRPAGGTAFTSRFPTQWVGDSSEVAGGVFGELSQEPRTNSGTLETATVSSCRSLRARRNPI